MMKPCAEVYTEPMTLGRQSPRTAKTKKTVRKSRKTTESFRPTVTAQMNVMDVIGLHPKAGDVLGEYGLHCFQCAFNTMDSVEAGARSHGLTDTDIENLVTDLNDLLAAVTPKPQMLTLTRAAAEGLKNIAKQEGKKAVALRVALDTQGGFFMEFDDTLTEDDRSFACDDIEDVSVVASNAVLWRIGGSEIDFRDGKFKLDLEEEPKPHACGCGGDCSCEKSSQ